MAEVLIRESLWQQFVSVAKRQCRRPERLAEAVLQEYLQRLDDELLLDATRRAARRAPFRTVDTEEVIRRYRRSVARKAADGRAEGKNPRRS